MSTRVVRSSSLIWSLAVLGRTAPYSYSYSTTAAVESAIENFPCDFSGLCCAILVRGRTQYQMKGSDWGRYESERYGKKTLQLSSTVLQCTTFIFFATATHMFFDSSVAYVRDRPQQYDSHSRLILASLLNMVRFTSQKMGQKIKQDTPPDETFALSRLTNSSGSQSDDAS